MIRDPVREAYSDRPDPDEPWRYVCPECGSAQIQCLVGSERSHKKRYGSGDAAEAAADRAARYRCRACRARRRGVLDKASGETTEATPRP